MGAPVTITRDKFTAAELRAASAKCSDGAQVRRILALALALVLECRPRGEAAALNATGCNRYNDDGNDGLKSRKSPGGEPFLSEAQKAALGATVIRGPDPVIHKVMRWRCVDLRAEVARLCIHPVRATASP